MKRSLVIWVGIYTLCIFAFFSNVFSYTTIAGGDYISFRPEHIISYKENAFSAWDVRLNLGINTVGLLHYAPYNFLSSYLGSLLGYNMILWERMMWWIPFFLFSFFSTIFLFRTLFPQNKFGILSPFIFVFNTYVLLVLSGGQIAGIGLAYAIAPLVFAAFIKNFYDQSFFSKKRTRLQKITESLLIGLIFSLQIMFDLRIAYVTIAGVGLLLFVSLAQQALRKNWSEILRIFCFSILIPFCITVLLHAYWLIPMALSGQNPIDQFGSAYNTTQAVSFLSFAQLEHTISLLHPNWPENIFGKVDFMKWWFLFVPVLAYSALFFSKKNETNLIKPISFFVLLGLLGSFLAKGANEPFGSMYLWLFENLPGFVMFRDPTKWYTLVALAYSVLIPVTLWHLYQVVISIKKDSKFSFLRLQMFKLVYFLPAVYLLYSFFILHPVWTLPIQGTLQKRIVPIEYQQLVQFLSAQKEYSRVLWIPETQRFGLPSDNHPAISGYELFKVSSLAEILAMVQRPGAEREIQEAAIKYVVIPNDSERELYITDREYDEKKYQEAVTVLRKIPWLKENLGNSKIKVFEVQNTKQHFWSEDVAALSYQTNSLTNHTLTIPSSGEGDTLVFSERYDSGWVAAVGEKNLKQTVYNKKYIRYILPAGENYKISIKYIPQQLVNKYLMISFVSFLVILVAVTYGLSRSFLSKK